MEMNSVKNNLEKIFNTFNGTNHELLDKFYDPHVIFQDAVLKITGLNQLKVYYAHAYKNVKSISFKFTSIRVSENFLYANWIMTAEIKQLNKGLPYEVTGLSELQVGENNLIIWHRDFVDLGEMVYERVPLIGSLIRKIKKLLKGSLA